MISIRKILSVLVVILLNLSLQYDAFAEDLIETRVSHGRLVHVGIPKEEALALQSVFDKAETNIIWFDFGVGVPKADFQNQNFANFLKIIADEFAINTKVTKAFIEVGNLPQPNSIAHLVCKVPSRIAPKTNAPEANVSINCKLIQIENNEADPDAPPQ